MKLNSLLKSSLLKNSFWGFVSTMLQTLFLSLFFILLSRHYTTTEFAHYLVVSSIYQLIVGISSLGLGTWFIREYEHAGEDKQILISRFLKIQIALGLAFYLLHNGLIFLLYPTMEIRLLALVIGTNIIFDNIIFALRSLNIAQLNQKKSAIILTIDAFARLLIICVLFIVPFSMLLLSIFLVVVRLLTLNIFMKVGVDANFDIKNVWTYKITRSDIKNQVFTNWRFVVIVAVSMLFWRSGTIIISKFLTMEHLANYEVSYKILSLFIIIPAILSATIYPRFVKLHAVNDNAGLRKFYKTFFLYFSLISMMAYAFIISFGDLIVPLLFGAKFVMASDSLKEMFLTFLIFPTVLLQANLIVAMKMEKTDMHINIAALAINISICIIGLTFQKSLSVVNYSIFISYLFFHIVQNLFLSKLKLVSFNKSILYYLSLALFVITYKYAVSVFNPAVVFGSFILLMGMSAIVYVRGGAPRLKGLINA